MLLFINYLSNFNGIKPLYIFILIKYLNHFLIKINKLKVIIMQINIIW